VGQVNFIVNECSFLVSLISQCYVCQIEVKSLVHYQGAILVEFSVVVFQADYWLVFIIWGVRFNKKMKRFGQFLMENLATSSRGCLSTLCASCRHGAIACCIVKDREPLRRNKSFTTFGFLGWYCK